MNISVMNVHSECCHVIIVFSGRKLAATDGGPALFSMTLSYRNRFCRGKL
jgi:hypothetical protein